MEEDQGNKNGRDLPPIIIVSGGVGASGEQLVHTVLAQFPGIQVPVITTGNVRHPEQIEQAVDQAERSRGMLVHTLVDSNLRQALTEQARAKGVPAIDLMGDLIEILSERSGREPANKPGLYRQLRRDYFERVEAIEFSMVHDDGKGVKDLPKAEIVILGVSRVGKSPLSLYLSVLGWKVANLPFVMGRPMPDELSQVNKQRVIGLTIEPGQLMLHRQERQRRLGAPGPSPYANPQAVYEEVETARRFYRRNGYTIIDVTDKPIESSADEVIRLITR